MKIQMCGKIGYINSKLVRNMRRNGHETSRISIIYVTESNGQDSKNNYDIPRDGDSHKLIIVILDMRSKII